MNEKTFFMDLYQRYEKQGCIDEGLCETIWLAKNRRLTKTFNTVAPSLKEKNKLNEQGLPYQVYR